MDFASVTRTTGNGSRERFAWAILLASFVTWLILLIAAPVGVSSFVRHASRPLMVSVQANEGAVRVLNNRGQPDALFVGEPEREIDEQTSILTSNTDTALISIYTPDGSQVLARVVVYDNTTLNIVNAAAPRFSMSSENYDLALNLQSGRLRISLPERQGRTIDVRISTPQEGEVVLDGMGQYSLEATNEATDVLVLEGKAVVTAYKAQLDLQTNERALMQTEGVLRGPLDNERNLVQNGDFSDGMAGWNPSAWVVDLQDQMAGEIKVVNTGGETALRFHRIGMGHAHVELWQDVMQDVTDFNSLELFVTMRIVQQSVGVCGVQGSECPLFVSVRYIDEHGTKQEWRQGFYAVGDIVAGSTPGVCQFCAAPRNPHLKIPLNQVHPYESGNLLEQLAQQNIKPRFIEGVGFWASGHTFETNVVNVGLIAVE